MAVHTAVMQGAPLSADSEPDSPSVADLSKLKTYSASDKITRYFCSVCFTHILHENKDKASETSSWAVYTGALERVEGVVKVGHHAFVEDTRDGGLANHYRVLEGKELPRYAREEGSDKLPQNWTSDTLLKKEVSPNGVVAYCHCKSVSIQLVTLRKEDGEDPSKWWAVPPKNPEDLASAGRVRFMCGHCLCTSCRRSNGALISTYILLPMANVNVLDGGTSLPISFKENHPRRPKGLKRYESSPLVFREYCDTCGANVLYWTTDPKRNHIPPAVDGEPIIINIAVGLIDEEDGGARADEWVYFADYVVRAEEGIDKAGMEALKEGVKPVTVASTEK
ncbi:hypothetical protein CVT25_002086 [Psilocybe cyanescens]|uniref:Uncharacterized protein n=1 Tax=Psilocybe cyanescens TaxID=93625 RepID=A0A409X9B3_PSICY|nr:hypothetical protein CVT25_002086 [Psilocybe cyanescens]